MISSLSLRVVCPFSWGISHPHSYSSMPSGADYHPLTIFQCYSQKPSWICSCLRRINYFWYVIHIWTESSLNSFIGNSNSVIHIFLLVIILQWIMYSIPSLFIPGRYRSKAPIYFIIITMIIIVYGTRLHLQY